MRTRFHEDDSLAALVRRAGLPLDGHAYGSLERVFAHQRSIEHLTGYLRVTGWGEGSAMAAAGLRGSKQADTLWDSDGSWKGSPALSKQMAADSLAARIRELAVATHRAGVWNSPTLVNTIESWGGAGLPVQQQIVRALGEAGAGLLAGTDALQTPRNLDYFKKIGVAVTLTPAQWRLDSLYGDAGATHREFQAFVDAGLTPYQALATGTRNVAAFFGRLASTGTITVGKRADLVLLAGNPLADIRQTERIAGVMLGGRWLDRAELDRRIGEIDAWSTRWCAAAGQVRRGVVKLMDRVPACPTVGSR